MLQSTFLPKSSQILVFLIMQKGRMSQWAEEKRLNISIKTTAGIKTCAHLNSARPKFFSFIEIRKTAHMKKTMAASLDGAGEC